MANLVLVSGDLMVSARIEGAARTCGLKLITLAAPNPTAPEFSNDCVVVLIDLKTAGSDIGALVAGLRQIEAPPAIIAFGPHVHEHSLAAAREAGCDLVVTRGQLERDAETILAQFQG